jgi:membrane-anchored mycosin MYCP
LTSGLVDVHSQLRPLDGTSFAVPYVAGLAALVRERFPHLSARQVMHRIEQTAQHTMGLRRRSEDVGYGMIDPIAALTAVLPEERGPKDGASPAPVNPAKLSGFPASPPDNTPRTVALAGSAAALVLLGLTLLVVQILKRQQRG